jgi:flavin-dependent thymidylate synthase
MEVKLASYTPDALNLLLRTKNTRLGFSADPSAWTEEQRAEHIAYMRDTIRSSWEFVDYVFEFNGVTRVFMQQLTRTRTGSYAGESMRTVDVREHAIQKPREFKSTTGELYWDRAEQAVRQAYSNMIDAGETVQDARGILPMNVETSMFAKFNLRTLSDTAKTRLCTRTQGEYQDAFRRMRALVVEVHPWASDFIEVHCVATGTCAFPRYGKKECMFYDPRMDQSAVIADTREKFKQADALGIRQVAIPVSKQGRTM